MSDSPTKPAPDEKPVQVSEKDYGVGYNKSGTVMIVSIPIKHWSELEDGDVMLAGVAWKIRAMGLRGLQLHREAAKEQAKRSGVIDPKDFRLPSGQTVH